MVQQDILDTYYDDIFSVLILTAICYVFFLYPRIKKIKEDLKFSDLGKTSSFIIHEIQKPISRIYERNVNDEDVNTIKKTIDIAKTLQSGTINNSVKEKMNIQQSLQNIIQKYDAYIEFFKIKMVIDIDSYDSQLDPVSFSLIMDNLIRNSIEANKEMPEENRWIKISSQKNKIIISNPFSTIVKDDEIFLPLKTSKPGNMGIGLHLCKTIADTQGYSLNVNTKDKNFQANLILP